MPQRPPKDASANIAPNCVSRHIATTAKPVRGMQFDVHVDSVLRAYFAAEGDQMVESLHPSFGRKDDCGKAARMLVF
jgi:hypothetical protein